MGSDVAEVAVGGGDLAFPAAGADRDIPHVTAGSPVPLTVPAEVPGLVNVVVVVIAELGVHAVAARTGEDFVWLFQ